MRAVNSILFEAYLGAYFPGNIAWKTASQIAPWNYSEKVGSLIERLLKQTHK